MSPQSDPSNPDKGRDAKNAPSFTFALAGNANVGKSVIFNQLTGSSQIIGNWPGKTVDRAEGTLTFEGHEIKIIDLPGIYSFSTFSMEERVSRDYIALEKPDAVINMVDASILERNLFFTIQLIELQAPLVLCLNQVDVAKSKGMIIDKDKLQNALGVPVVFATAIRGEGIYEVIQEALKVTDRKQKPPTIQYRPIIEEKIQQLQHLIQKEALDLQYPSRWLAIKLLEGDNELTQFIADKSKTIADASKKIAAELQHSCQEPCFSLIASERYAIASQITASALQQSEIWNTFSDKLEWVTTHKIWGYVTSVSVIVGLLLWTFFVGNALSSSITHALNFIYPVDPALSAELPLLTILINGLWGGFSAGLTLIIPFVIPFYLLLAVIEDSGILTRVAFMMDSAMHKIGLHGKALIPIILGYGCSVPAIQACKIMETRRERLLAAFAITFAPCSARTLILFGMVGLFVGVQWALLLYVIDVAVILVLGRVAMKAVPGKSTGLIMELSNFKMPSPQVVLKQTWIRTKSIIYVVFPIYLVGSILIQVAYALNVLSPLSDALAPLTVWWLGLPAFVGVLLILGTIRKEFVLIGAVAILGTTNLLAGFTPVQLVILALVAMLYLPCVSTIAILGKEFGWKVAATISAANIGSALLIGGIMFRILSLIIPV
ncbi:ferrous iron transport protein B [Candidatus Bathycorpusculum sp.]|uniref:ferrous iron transport protein B n=1 Tax=Candidatus Bathycorpusculum sp. TaxID=2994959 RepID=UPI00282EEC85|nr:ferrous iron transport protein B [Candidatus Termitimicrobium sp.]MCL2432789.1 ferrous iron transport protein B [Candidatus Termitimicrobium sp.]